MSYYFDDEGYLCYRKAKGETVETIRYSPCPDMSLDTQVKILRLLNGNHQKLSVFTCPSTMADVEINQVIQCLDIIFQSVNIQPFGDKLLIVIQAY